MVLLQLGKDISAETIGNGGSSSPEISSENSSLTNGHSSLSDVINEWKHELEERKCELRNKTAKVSDLEERLRIKETEIGEIQNDLKSVQIERDKNCLMVSSSFIYFYCEYIFVAVFLSSSKWLCTELSEELARIHR